MSNCTFIKKAYGDKVDERIRSDISIHVGLDPI